MPFVFPRYWKKISPATGSARSPSGSVAFCTLLFHGAPYRERHLGRRRRLVGFTLPATSATAHAGFRLRFGFRGRLPLRIFEGSQHHPVRLAGQERLLSVDAQRKVVDGELGPRPCRAEKPRFDHHIVLRGERPLRRADGVSRELGRNRHRARLSVGLILGRSRSGRHALRFVDGRLFAWRVLPLCAQAEGGDPDTSFQHRRKSHSNLQANIAGGPAGDKKHPSNSTRARVRLH